jgi:hypothetical protein
MRPEAEAGVCVSALGQISMPLPTNHVLVFVPPPYFCLTFAWMHEPLEFW